MQVYSVQFERFNHDTEKLLASSMRLGPEFCESFPISCSSGYVAYKELCDIKDLPDHEFWFSTVMAKNEVDAYQEAIIALYNADLEKPLPLNMRIVDDSIIKEMN